MTPEERADALGQRWPLFADAGVKSAVLAALRAAVDEEREACAKLIENRLRGFSCQTCGSDEFAAMIRARGDLE